MYFLKPLLNGRASMLFPFTALLTLLSLPMMETKLVPADAMTGDSFGYSVGVDDEIVVVGAYLDDDLAQGSGAAYVFENVNGVWTEKMELHSMYGGVYDYFGQAVTADNNHIVVGSHNDGPTPFSNPGSIYVFPDSSDSSTFARFTGSDSGPYDRFGFSVAMDQDTIIVGARDYDSNSTSNNGGAYIFTGSGTTWTEQAILTQSDAAYGDSFGHAVAISGDTAVISAVNDQGAGWRTGSIYIFKNIGGNWVEQTKIEAFDKYMYDQFGYSVAISGNTILVGSPYDDDGGGSSGSVYVYVEKVNGWELAQKFLSNDPNPADTFGYTLSLEGDVAIIGAPGDDESANGGGAIYRFERNGTNWTQTDKRMASDASNAAQFGNAVAFDGTTEVAGSYADSVVGSASGSAYVFDQ